VTFTAWLRTQRDRDDSVGRVAQLLGPIELGVSPRQTLLQLALERAGLDDPDGVMAVCGDFARAWQEWPIRSASWSQWGPDGHLDPNQLTPANVVRAVASEPSDVIMLAWDQQAAEE